MSARTMSPREVFEASSRLMQAGRGVEAAEKYFSRDYIEHNPSVAGGNWEGFVQMIRNAGFGESGGPKDRQLEFHRHHVICEGDYVVVHQHVTEPNKPVLIFMDIYRIKDGKIVEHWDVVQSPPENPANTRHRMY